jgi:8-oxo-dGTP pyrophosphatase MutT (NUDIX family)
MADYNKIGLLCVRDGRMLLCRKKRGTRLLILPGGCLEDGETPLVCLERELREELGNVRLTDARYVGTYTHEAADPGRTVRIELYQGELLGDPAPHSEIAELVWFGADDDRKALAPSISAAILPDLLRRGLLS